MADKKPDQEPSIEEILASIRQIISDDEGDTGAPASAQGDDDASAPAAASVSSPEPEVFPEPVEEKAEDIIDLTEKVIAGKASIDPIQVALRDAEDDPPEAEFDSVTDSFADSVSGVKFSSESEPEEFPVMAGSMTQEDAAPLNENHYADDAALDSLLTARAEKAALGAFSKIAARAPVYREDAPADGHTIEDVVRSLLRPLLREWLDENLPPMIERLVQRELEKLARRTLM